MFVISSAIKEMFHCIFADSDPKPTVTVVLNEADGINLGVDTSVALLIGDISSENPSYSSKNGTLIKDIICSAPFNIQHSGQIPIYLVALQFIPDENWLFLLHKSLATNSIEMKAFKMQSYILSKANIYRNV